MLHWVVMRFKHVNIFKALRKVLLAQSEHAGSTLVMIATLLPLLYYHAFFFLLFFAVS